MSLSATALLTLGKGVKEFLKEKGIEEGFATLCELAKECYAGLVRLEAELWDDVDEEERKYVAVTAIVPAGYPIDQALAEERTLSRLRVERIPWSAAQHLSHMVWHAAR